MSNTTDFDLDVVMAKVGFHLHNYTDGRLANLASTLPVGSEERALINNLIGSLLIVDDSARIALAQESLRVKEEDPENRDENIMAEVMFGIMANSYLDARCREVVYRVLHKALFGTEVSSEEPVTYCVPEMELDAIPVVEAEEVDTEAGSPRWSQPTESEEDKWIQMIDEEAEKDGGLEQGEQPLVLDDNGVIRFRENRIINLLLEGGPFDLNQIALMAFTDQERQQLAQLIGYSVSGYGDLSYASGEPTERADRAVDIFVAEQEAGG